MSISFYSPLAQKTPIIAMLQIVVLQSDRSFTKWP